MSSKIIIYSTFFLLVFNIKAESTITDRLDEALKPFYTSCIGDISSNQNEEVIGAQGNIISQSKFFTIKLKSLLDGKKEGLREKNEKFHFECAEDIANRLESFGLDYFELEFGESQGELHLRDTRQLISNAYPGSVPGILHSILKKAHKGKFQKRIIKTKNSYSLKDKDSHIVCTWVKPEITKKIYYCEFWDKNWGYQVGLQQLSVTKSPVAQIIHYLMLNEIGKGVQLDALGRPFFKIDNVTFRSEFKHDQYGTPIYRFQILRHYAHLPFKGGI